MVALQILCSCAVALTPSLSVPALRRAPAPLHVGAKTMTATTTGGGGGDEDDRSGRVIIALLAGAGAIETGVLTVEKLWPSGALSGLCLPGGGCADVLNGPWSTVLGVPLAAFGLVAYASMAALAAQPLVLPRTDDAVADVSAPGTGVLVFGSGALASFSACLMLLLLLVVQQTCVLCIASAGLSSAILLTAWRTPLLRSKTDTAVLTASGALVSAAAAAALFAAQGGAELADVRQEPASAQVAPVAPPAIRASSSARALGIAKQLQARGARFYGAYWCSHCRDQKEALGAEAMRLVPYLECDANGAGSRRAECTAAGIRGYPTWQLDGALFAGERDLDELELMLAGEVEPDGVAASK